MRFAAVVVLALLLLPAVAMAGPPTGGLAAFHRRDFQTAVKIWQPLAEQGNAHAQFDLGVMYERGLGVEQDYAEAMKWYRKAADQGDAHGQHGIAKLYSIGDGVPQDYVEAMKWDRKAADQGYANAQFTLGVNYYAGRGSQQDYGEALKLWRKAADQGDSSAQYWLGRIYKAGLGVPQDYPEAMKWFLKAADQGDAGAQFELGVIYFTGNYGLKVDNTENLGSLDGTNWVTPNDYVDAAKWFRKAADQGDAYAQSDLGQMYEKGLGVGQDLAEAYFWYGLAKKQSPIPDEVIMKIEEQLTAKQRATVERRIREWKPTSGQPPAPAEATGKPETK